MTNIKLYQFNQAWGLPNPSTFCMKLETYLRAAKIPHDVVYANDPRRSPKGKIPFVSIDGQMIGDSEIIMDMLKQQFGDTLDQHLSDTEKATALGYQRLCEDHLYWVGVYSRWTDELGWKVLKPLFFGGMPKFKGALVAKMLRKHMQKELYNQGLGRHNQTEIYEMGVKDLRALAAQLKDKTYFFGDKISSIDTCVYSIIANCWYQPIPTPLKEEIKRYPYLVDYCDRILDQYFPELNGQRKA